MTHFSEFRLSPAHVGRRDASAPYTPPPVVVSYFDPKTGEPRDSKAGAETAAKGRGARRWGSYSKSSKPVLVDGEVFESQAAALLRTGGSRSTLVRILREGGGQYRGHAVAYADKETQCQSTE